MYRFKLPAFLQSLLSKLKFSYQKYIGNHVAIIQEAYPYPAKIAAYFIQILSLFFSGLFFLYLLLLFGAWGGLPDNHEIKEIKNYTASEIYSEDSVLLGKYFKENRTNALFDELPQHLLDALVSTEDSRFFEHKGVDFFSFLRVLFVTVILNDASGGGGSTISQQLAKNLYGRNTSIFGMPANKMREMLIAGKLERYYSKNEILTLYFNTVPFGENCFGIEASALRFFNKLPNQLKIEEAAVLVGLLKANTTYNPKKNPENALNRRNVVLNQMTLNQKLNRIEYDSIKQLPLVLDYNNDTQSDGPAAYFREHLRIELDKICKEKIPKKDDGTYWNIYTDGLKIYTTINAHMQSYAEQSVKEQMISIQKSFNKEWGNKDPWGKSVSVVTNGMKRSDRYKNLKEAGYSEKEITANFEIPTELKLFTWNGIVDTLLSPIDSIKHSLKYLRTGFLAMEPSTGNIKAWVGGINNTTYKYDHVKAKRQVGSTFKPIVYGAAMEYDSLTPCDYVLNQKNTYTDYNNWSPNNSDGNYGGMYSLKGGLTYSVNTIAAELIMHTGISNVIALAKKMGIQSKIPSVPSIALGSADLSLLEMVTAYCAIDNKGFAVTPNYLIKIETADGEIIYESPVIKKTKAMSSLTASYLVDMLQSVVNNGTASRLRGTYGLSNPLAGKTGTTQNNTDGWFIGFTPRLVAGAWVGAEDPSIKFKSTGLGQGAATALPIFGKFLSKISKDKSVNKSLYGNFYVEKDSSSNAYDCPLFLPDSINLDSLGFIPKILGEIKIEKDTIQQKLDSILITKPALIKQDDVEIKTNENIKNK